MSTVPRPPLCPSTHCSHRVQAQNHVGPSKTHAKKMAGAKNGQHGPGPCATNPAPCGKKRDATRVSMVEQVHKLKIVAAFGNPQQVQLEAGPGLISQGVSVLVEIAPTLFSGLCVATHAVWTVGWIEFVPANLPLVTAQMPSVDEEIARCQKMCCAIVALFGGLRQRLMQMASVVVTEVANVVVGGSAQRFDQDADLRF